MTDASPELTPQLREIATAHGVATEYWDWRGQHVDVERDTLVAVLAALGVDASSEAAAQAALADRWAGRWRQMLPPCLVTQQGRRPRFWAHVPHGDPVEVWVELEDGGIRHDVAQQDHWVEPADVDGRLVGEATYELPGDLPLGWHRLHARSAGRVADVPLVVTPSRLSLPAAAENRRIWGFMTQLYSVRSRASWGLGDLDDLAELAAWSGYELGAGFVLVNPMHAPEPVPPIEASPYLPVTRRFASPLYLRVEAVPETAYLAPDDRARVEQLAAELRKRNDDDLLDRDAVWEAKREALALVHAVPRSPARQASYAAFRAREGDGLVDFATWNALAERHGPEWSAWPQPLRDPRSAAVARQREVLADRVDFHCWLQWLLDEQRAAAQRRGRDAGMPVGVVHDLAVGVHPHGADTWALGDALAAGVTAGAPPDAFNQQGQDWSQPPWRPDRLAATGYAAYRDMLRTVLRNAGGIRVDHVMGLFRLWWVPDGRPPSEGTYVSYDHEALVGILLLEAERAGAVVVGEDLGTVEPWVRDYLRERGVFGTSILWFEHESDGALRQPERWRELCLATVTSHDLPPTAGYLAGEHVELRGRLGLLTRSLDEERAAHVAEQADWRALLERLRLLRPGAGEQQTVETLHRFLLGTPARMLGVALADAVGDRRVHNQPGTHEEYPNWRLPLADENGSPVLLEDLVRSPRVRSLARVFESL